MPSGSLFPNCQSTLVSASARNACGKTSSCSFEVEVVDTLPPGFAETKVADGLNPTTMSFAPDGRLFLCEKQGLLRVIDGKGTDYRR